MGLWNRLFGRELRAEVVTADDHLTRLMKGIEISPETAMEIPAVSACVGFISTCIAGLPVKLYRENRRQNSTEEIKDDIRLRLLNDETGDLLDPFQMKQAVVSDYFLYGGGFIYPEMVGNEFVSLRYIKHGAITSYLSGTDPIFKVGEYILSNGMRLRDDEVVRLLHDTKDGLKGESIIDQHQQLLSAMYREIVYEKLLVSSGGNKKGFLTSEAKLTAEMLADLRQKWQEMYANTGNTMMVLNKGITFHESSNTSVEMQLNENKARNNALVCQLFGMSPEAVSGQLGEDALAAVIKGAVVPVITAFEAALNRGLLLPSERDWMYFTFDTTELLKGDILKRYQAYKTGLECNVLQIDEARYKEDLPPLGLNFIKLGLQDVLFDPKTKVIYTPNMNQSMVMSENKVSFGEKDSGKPIDNAADDDIMEERADGETRLVCVWGSPLSGKTTFVQNHAGKSDIIWDWDKIQQAVSLSDSYQESSPQTLRLLLQLRKTFIKAASDCGAKTAWLICCRPNKYVRDLLGDKAEYIKMDVSKDECYRRLAADNSRPDKQKMAALIEDFFSKEPYEERGWVTINGRHVFIGDDGGGGSSGSGGGSASGADAPAKDSGYGFKTITDDAINGVPKVDVFGDDERNSRYQQANQDLLREAQKYPVGTEVSRVYGADMKPISGYGYRVGTEQGEAKIDNPSQPYHAFHNHPSGNALSPTDVIGMTKRENMQSITAVGNDGKLYCVSKTSHANSAGYRLFMRDQCKQKRFLGKYSYFDVASKSFDASKLTEQERTTLRNQLSSFCESCASGGVFYGFKYTKK